MPIVCYNNGMAHSLRDRQKQVAREAILTAAADLIVANGLEQLSLQDVADAAGVSKRTLYNYYDNREALLTAIGEWSDELTLEGGGFLVPDGLEALPAQIPEVWRTWKEQGNVYQAVMIIDGASSDAGPSKGRRIRRQAIARAVAQIRPELDGERSLQLASVVHALSSAPVYRRLTTEDGLSVETAAGLAGWTISLITEALASGQDPFK